MSIRDYIFLGFDFRVGACPIKTVDVFLCEQAEAEREQIIQLGYKENIAQQLDCAADLIESYVSSAVTGMAITCSPNTTEIVKRVYGWPVVERPYSTGELLARGWKFEGFDVADADGFFSVFGIDANDPKLNVGRRLFESEAEAQKFVVPAATLYPTHAPFIVFGILLFDEACRPGEPHPPNSD